MLTFIGILGAADRQVPDPIGFDNSGAPIYHWPEASGFFIAVEFAPGMSRRPVAKVTFNSNPNDPNALPDFQIKSDMNLGNGSRDICDTGGQNSTKIGGVPADTMDGFGGSQFAANAINDFSCRFEAHQSSGDACTNNSTGNPQFVCSSTSNPQFVCPAQTTLQFCTPLGVGMELAFPMHARTRITARARDDLGQPGPAKSMIVEIE